MKTFATDGLILWIEDPLIESSFTIEIQNRQVLFCTHSPFFIPYSIIISSSSLRV